MNKASDILVKPIEIASLSVAEQGAIKGGMITCEEKRPKIRR